MLYKFHLSTIKSVKKKNKRRTFLSPLENVVWLWSGNLHDRLPMNRENDCLINEGTLSQSWHLKCWCPWTDHLNWMWSYRIQEDNKNKFGDEQAGKWGKEARKPFCLSACLIIIIQSDFQSVSPPPSLPVYISPETHFIPKLKIMPIPFIFSCDSITSKKNEEERIWWFSERRTMCNFVW